MAAHGFVDVYNLLICLDEVVDTLCRFPGVGA